MNKNYKLILSAVISFGGLYFAFHGENFQELIQQFRQVQWLPFWISVLLLLFSCLVRALRWQYILNPVAHIAIHPLFGSVMIGYFGNNILPFRMGELLRAYSISSQSSISVSQAFGTVILERIMDLAAVLFIFLMVAPWYPFEHKSLELGIMIFTGITILIIIAILIIYYFRVLDRIKSWAIFQTRLGAILFNLVENIFDGLTLLSKTKHTSRIILTSIFIWMLYYFSTYLVLTSCRIDIGFIGAIIVLIIGGFIISIPALPGMAGTYDAGIKYGLIAVYAITGEKALAYALISHAGMYFPFLLVGGAYFILGSIHLKDIKNQSIEV